MGSEPLAFPPAPGGDPWGDTPLSDLPVVALDAETGGLDPVRSPLLTIGLATWEGLVLEATVHTEHYMPDAQVLDINGITSARAASGLPWALLEGILAEAFAGRVALAHNAGFDLSFLAAKATSLELPAAIDTAACSRYLWPNSKADLTSLCARAKVTNTGAHGAGADATAAAKCWLYLRAALRNAGIDTWNQLCSAEAQIPSRFERPAWPEQVAQTLARGGATDGRAS